MIYESVEFGMSRVTLKDALTGEVRENYSDKISFGIIGGGSWAIGLAKIVMSNSKYINWYMRRQDPIDDFIRLGRNPSYLIGLNFNTNRITFSNDINKVVKASDVLIFATASPYLKNHINDLKRQLDDTIIISVIKGIVHDENLLISEYFHERLNVPMENILAVGILVTP